MKQFSPEDIAGLQDRLNSFLDDCTKEEKQTNLLWLVNISAAIDCVRDERQPKKEHLSFLLLKLFLDSFEADFFKKNINDYLESINDH